MLKNAARSHFLQMDRHATLPFMWLINILSRTSAIPQPRSMTDYKPHTKTMLWTTRGPPDHQKEIQTDVVWTCLQFIRNHLARHSEKETRQSDKEVGRQHQGMDMPGVRQIPEGSGEQRKMEETDCEVNCGAPMTPAVKR